MENFFIVDNAILKNTLSKLRDKSLKPNDFRKGLSIIAKILLSYALEKENTYLKKVETPIGEGNFSFLAEENFVIIPILRAGLPMLDGCLEMLPEAKVGFLALKRNEETLESVLYYERLPNLENKVVIIVDPMVATGGSLEYAIEVVKKYNPKKIISLNVIISPNGLKRLEKYKDVNFYIASIDEGLNSKGFIVPGIGDAGDRAFNTEE